MSDKYAREETFYPNSEDLEWLRETHLRNVHSTLPIPEFHSFVLTGNEDCPQSIRLYVQRHPRYTDSPIAVYVLNGETLTWEDEYLKP